MICGASAGGYTTLCALATTTRFAAGTARSAIADPAAWRTAASRFQRHHTTDLIGPWPQAADTYRLRSALHDSDRITAPGPACPRQPRPHRLPRPGRRARRPPAPPAPTAPCSSTLVRATRCAPTLWPGHDAELALYRDAFDF